MARRIIAPMKAEPSKPKAFEQFETLAKRLLSVPKKDADKKARDYERKKRASNNGR